MNKIALVAHVPQDQYDILNAMLDEEELRYLCDVVIYGDDSAALDEALSDCEAGAVDGVVALDDVPCGNIADDMDALLPVHVTDKVRTASVEGDATIGDAAMALRQYDVVERASQLAHTLRRDLDVLNPRVAVLSLNRDITFDNTSEEMNIIAPAVSELVKSGVQAFGPLAAGKFFSGKDLDAYDAVLTMYDSQCADAVRELSDAPVLTLMAGLTAPLVICREAEGLLAAVYMAIDVARHRERYDAPLGNPLPKLYHERREDGDKARFRNKKA